MFDSFLAFSSLAAIVLVFLHLRRRLKKLKEGQRQFAEAANRMAEIREEMKSFEQRLGEPLQRSLSSLRQQADHCSSRVDHLEHESSKPSSLSRFHPERIGLSDTVMTPMLAIRNQLDNILFPNERPLDDLDWMHKLRTKNFPYSVTDEEGLLLYKLITDNDFQCGYEIATAFGYSSFFMGLAFKATGGSLLSVDAYVEEAQEDYLYSEEEAKLHADSIRMAVQSGDQSQIPEGLRFARWGASQLGLDRVVNYEIGFSPSHVSDLVGDKKIDFAFIDGGHFGKQPIRDIEAILPHRNEERFAMVLHDTHCDAVAKAVHFASSALGVSPVVLPTRNQLVFIGQGVKAETLQQCRRLTIRQAA